MVRLFSMSELDYKSMSLMAMIACFCFSSSHHFSPLSSSCFVNDAGVYECECWMMLLLYMSSSNYYSLYLSAKCLAIWSVSSSDSLGAMFCGCVVWVSSLKSGVYDRLCFIRSWNLLRFFSMSSRVLFLTLVFFWGVCELRDGMFSIWLSSIALRSELSLLWVSSCYE